MVSELELAPAVEEEVPALDIVDGEDNQAPAEEPAEQTPDPLADALERLGRTEAETARLAAQLQRWGSALGDVPKLRSDLQSLTAKDPTAAIDPRLEANEALLTRVADALMSSPLTDDESKAALRAARSGLDEARGQRAQQRMRAELLAEITGALPQQQEPSTQPAPEASSATERVVGYAEAKGVNPADIPATAWSLQPNETYEQAIMRVKGVVDALVDQDAAATRVASRRTAAGPGTPARVGTNSIESERQRLQDEGLPITAEAERKRIAAALGVEL